MAKKNKKIRQLRKKRLENKVDNLLNKLKKLELISQEGENCISRLFSRHNSAFEYVLTYKFSQDPLEMFFSKIQSRNGWNNNPNPLQLKWALRALLMKNNIEASKNANCIIEDIPSQNSSSCVDDSLKAILDSSAIWKDDVLFYISGFISHSLKKKVKCSECVASLYQAADSNYISYGSSSLTECKAYGDLLIPSMSVF